MIFYSSLFLLQITVFRISSIMLFEIFASFTSLWVRRAVKYVIDTEPGTRCPQTWHLTFSELFLCPGISIQLHR